jgi:hypothetical protein
MYITDADRIYSGIRNGKFKYLGRGAGRHVFDMGDGRVVKVARNEFGYDQNKTEYALSLAYKGDLFAKVISVSEDHRLLIMQAAKWVSNLAPVLKYYNVRSTKELFDVPEVFALIRNHRLVAREFLRPRNWGFIGGRPVIIDYGIIWQTPPQKAAAVNLPPKAAADPPQKAAAVNPPPKAAADPPQKTAAVNPPPKAAADPPQKTAAVKSCPKAATDLPKKTAANPPPCPKSATDPPQKTAAVKSCPKSATDLPKKTAANPFHRRRIFLIRNPR